jgi:hypothetical protein
MNLKFTNLSGGGQQLRRDPWRFAHVQRHREAQADLEFQDAVWDYLNHMVGSVCASSSDHSERIFSQNVFESGGAPESGRAVPSYKALFGRAAADSR